jgi:hypothetical protein
MSIPELHIAITALETTIPELIQSEEQEGTHNPKPIEEIVDDLCALNDCLCQLVPFLEPKLPSVPGGNQR